MHWALQLLIAIAVAALSAATVSLLLAARRAAIRAERVSPSSSATWSRSPPRRRG